MALGSASGFAARWLALTVCTRTGSGIHTFAHDFLMSGGQERDLKRLAGWSSDVMLERYGASAADVRAKATAQRLKRGDRV
jgi:hypothetical protein